MNISKKVLIIGGTSGIGLEVARIFSVTREVVIIGRNINKISSDQILKNALKFSCDIADKQQRDELLCQLDSLYIDTIIHCAGIFQAQGQDKVMYEKAYRDVKLGGVEIIRKVMKFAPGEVKNVCAVSSLYTFLPHTLVPTFEKGVQKELECAVLSLKGVVVNCVAPGLVDTPLTRAAYGEDKMKEILLLAPGSRMLEPMEVAREIYEISNQQEISGKVILVDGDFLKFLAV
jgi:3-oxoacyl-[acyl-carrier protein] reductase